MTKNYRIQVREWSSNILEKRTIGENGKDKWIPFVAPLVIKIDGDKITEDLLEYYNK